MKTVAAIERLEHLALEVSPAAERAVHVLFHTLLPKQPTSFFIQKITDIPDGLRESQMVFT